MLSQRRGGRVRPPRFQFYKGLSLTVLAVSLLFTHLRGESQGRLIQNRPRRFPQGHFQGRPKPPRNNIDPLVLALLKKMIRPGIDYAGEQIVETRAMGGRTARQRVWGSANGQVRRDYIAPDEMKGDITISGARQFRKYNHKTNVVDIAVWPQDEDEVGNLRLNMLKAGRGNVQQVGEEIVAGRTAAIIELATERGLNGMGRVTKLWLDKENGLKLKTEMSDANGMFSRTYFTTITIGASANITPQIFTLPQVKGMRLNPLFPTASHFQTVEEARADLPFTPLVPGTLPNKFRLFGVWILGANPKRPGTGSVLLGYTDGVSNFSLFERIVRPPLPDKPRPPLRLKGNKLDWKMALSDGRTLDVTYIGHLVPEQITALYDSLR